MHICPVCGYDKLYEEPYDKFGCSSFEICPCCGFEYGYDDYNCGYTFEEYRNEWIKNGCVWFSEKRNKPKNWDLNKQLENLIK